MTTTTTAVSRTGLRPHEAKQKGDLSDTADPRIGESGHACPGNIPSDTAPEGV